MKLFAGWLGVAILVFTFTGCGDDTDALTDQAPPPPGDGRPAGFEKMMRGMDKDMKNATANPKGLAKAAAGAPAKAEATPPAKAD